MSCYYACPNGHEVAKRQIIQVRCETEGCTARIAYEPIAHGLALARQLKEAREIAKRAVGCTGANDCLGPISAPRCEPCVAFAREHLWTSSPNPIE
jgi:hypothetical protein